MGAPQVTWEQTRAFRLARMHVTKPLGPRSLRRVGASSGGYTGRLLPRRSCSAPFGPGASGPGRSIER